MRNLKDTASLIALAMALTSNLAMAQDAVNNDSKTNASRELQQGLLNRTLGIMHLGEPPANIEPKTITI